jgi:hypothetical protein
MDIPERDWKKMRSMKDELLNMACDRILEKVQKVIDARGNESHKSYLELWQVLRTEDDQVSPMFDEFKRNTAIFKLSVWHRNSIIGDEKLSHSGEETKERVYSINEISR